MDRKGLIILILCAVLAGLNIYYGRQLPHASPPKQSQKIPLPPSQASHTPSPTPQLNASPKIENKVKEATLNLQASHASGKPSALFTFSSKGGGITSAQLADAYVVGSSTQHIVLNTPSEAPVGAIIQRDKTPLLLDYQIKKMGDTVLCAAVSPEGLSIAKRWKLLAKDDKKPQNAWSLQFDITFTNTSNTSIKLSDYGIFYGSATPLHKREWDNQGGAFFLSDGDFTNTDATWFNKGFFRGARHFFQESAPQLSYAGVSNQFFTTILRPLEPFNGSVWATTHAFPHASKKSILGGFNLPSIHIHSGEKRTFSFLVYMGPKSYQILKKMPAHTSEVMHYGWFTPVSVLLSNVLHWLHDSLFEHLAHAWAWGLSIIALTILIRICIWPLHNKATRSMKRMSKLQPLMANIREKHKDDPQKVNAETMKLYREYHINPVGGCLPMFLQIPIFFGYYRMLQYAVELRGQSFLWIKDLSMPDTIYEIPFNIPFLGSHFPINLLPILMAITMVLQMRMTPRTGDKMQQRIFMFMPFMFFMFCYNFASALALYWTTQNIFSIGQTWLMNRLPEPELKKRRPKKGKKTFMERMAARAEELKREQEAAKKATRKKRR